MALQNNAAQKVFAIDGKYRREWKLNAGGMIWAAEDIERWRAVIKFRRVDVWIRCLIIVTCIFAWPTGTFAQHVTVRLKGGGSVSGKLAENAPGHHVTILTQEGEPFRIPQSQIERVELDLSSSNAASPTSGPPAPAIAPTVEPQAAPAVAGEDVVELHNGRLVRGTIIQRSPKHGVRIRLQDGKTQKFTPFETAYAGRAELGALHVEARSPGHVHVDGSYAGTVPVDVGDLQPGPAGHLVRIDFDGGGSSQERVLVHAGRTIRVELVVPPTIAAARYREGLTVVIGMGPLFGVLDQDPLGGAQVLAGANWGWGRRTDLRAVAFVSIGGYENGTVFEFGVRPSARFNLGSSYSIELGVRLGLLHDGPDTAFEIGPELSLLSFRLGDLRQYELTFWQACPFAFVGGTVDVAFRTGLSLGYLFLD